MAGNSGNPIDTDLMPSNIKNGVNIFGVLGNLSTLNLPGGPSNTFSLLSTFYGVEEYFAITSVVLLTGNGFYDDGTYIWAVYGIIIASNYSSATDTDIFKVFIQRINKSDLSVTTYTSNTGYYEVNDSSTITIRQDAGIIYIVGNAGAYVSFDTSTQTFSGFSGTNNAYISPIGTSPSFPGKSTTAIVGAGSGSVLPTTVSLSGKTFAFSDFKNTYLNAGDDIFICTGICFITYT